MIYLIQHWLNTQVSYKTGLSPFHAHFGSEDSTYFKLPESTSSAETTQAFVRLLDDNLRTLWEIIVKRGGNKDPELQNRYQAGNLVLFQRDKSKPLPTKLTMRFSGLSLSKRTMSNAAIFA